MVIGNYQFGKKIEELDLRIDELEKSIHLNNISMINTQAMITSYKIEASKLKTMIDERTDEIKDLTEEIEKTSVKQKDLQLMAQLIEAESGNQPFEGKLAVGTVVMNRIQSDEFPDTIEDVVFQRGQFQVVDNGRIYNEPSEDSLEAAKEIMDGKRVLNSNVLYFYNPKITSRSNWIRKLKVTKVIKDHAFVI
jgi:N-acetylmuramoyl-L-alanine amidase